MNFKKSLLIGAATLGFSMSAMASPVNVGGVTWDPDQTLAFPSLADFVANGTIFETGAVSAGDIVTGRGQVTQINSAVPNTGSFCPGCELTFTFSMELAADFVGVPNLALGGVDGTFAFKDLNIKFFVDHSPEFDGTMASAADGNLWLELVLNPSNLLTGTGIALGSGSDQGTGSGVLDVIGGLAMGNFDTNTQAAGGDLTLTSSFQPTDGAPGLLNGTFDLKGNSIPEPSGLALMGLGLLAFGSLARRKS
ncbi:PEP-CTERM sorting domain-containing protein [Aestuariibacter halophilus]|uniref:PEP-CTERM sorting domain-containing protein n=1 Tax=Fluctibacter halophilus TaxID=226011 RepID=A0ABS8G2V7_9ALTE|nr:PEP-CTERM sorting domain-containing protein [Aestuariibacter halophilus]MCC2614900.1 PEP-CTERM sorting domain-containing protein [Aestuariibacter halophilus]